MAPEWVAPSVTEMRHRLHEAARGQHRGTFSNVAIAANERQARRIRKLMGTPLWDIPHIRTHAGFDDRGTGRGPTVSELQATSLEFTTTQTTSWPWVHNIAQQLARAHKRLSRFIKFVADTQSCMNLSHVCITRDKQLRVRWQSIIQRMTPQWWPLVSAALTLRERCDNTLPVSALLAPGRDSCIDTNNGIRGGAPDKNISNLSPTSTPYITTVYMGYSEDPHNRIAMRALVDSGCSTEFISKRAFHRIREWISDGDRVDTLPIPVTCAFGSRKTSEGAYSIATTIPDSEGGAAEATLDFHVLDGIDVDVIF